MAPIVASSDRALVLQESFYPPVHYIPRDDAVAALLRPRRTPPIAPTRATVAISACRAKRALDAAWSYPEPYAAVAAIKDYLAFYPNRARSNCCRIENPSGTLASAAFWTEIRYLSLTLR